MAANVARRSFRLFVGNITWTVSQQELGNFFTKFGSVKEAKIIFDKSGLSKGYGFVTFQNKKGYEAVLSQDVLSLNGQILAVKPVLSRAAVKQETSSPKENKIESESV